MDNKTAILERRNELSVELIKVENKIIEAQDLEIEKLRKRLEILEELTGVQQQLKVNTKKPNQN